MIGTLLKDRFYIVKSLGKGNFSKTFLAQDTHKWNAECAVKRLITPTDPNHVAIVREMFEREAKKLYDLNHHGIPQLIAHFEHEGEFYLVQDLIDGHTMEDEIYAHNKWTESQVKDFLLEVLEILAYVHSQRSIHRDVKPSNLMRRNKDRKLMLIDFGAVKEVRNTATNLEVGKASGTVVIGTAAYMGAEQSKGNPCFASDVYSLGCIAIEALIGKSPDKFEYDPYSEILWRDRARVSEDFAKIIDKMVRYKWGERYRNAGEVLEVLQGSQTVVKSPIKEVRNLKTKRIPKESKPVNQGKEPLKSRSKKVVKEPVPTKSLIDFSAISTRRKLLIGLAVATPLAIVAWESLKPKPLVNEPIPPSPTAKPLRTETINNIITVDSYGREISRTSSTIKYFTESLNLPNGAVPLEMARIPKGKFTMGSPSSEKERRGNESPQHEVNFPQEFYMGRYAVTQAQWLAVMGKFTDEFNSGLEAKFKGNNLPMVAVSWYEAREFCKRLTSTSNRGTYRLPTEAEWEYACRAGTTTPFHFGETITPSLVNYDGNNPYANAPRGEYRQQTFEVNSFTPNPWGLYQMHGNVWEWCLDEYVDTYSKKSSNLKNNGSELYGEVEINDNAPHLVRGGSWFSFGMNCRSALREESNTRKQESNAGFRLLRSYV